MDVVATKTGDEAWSLIEKGYDFDLLITDVRMPGQIDGMELAYRYKSQIPEAKIIVISGYVGGRHSAETKAYNFLPKPFTLQQLASLIHKVSPTMILVGH